MGATMETQPTQPGLMQIFSSTGLATDNSIPAIDGKNSDNKGFSSLLSGYLPINTQLQPEAINDELLSQRMLAGAPIDSLNSTVLGVEGLPLLGQTLPLDEINLDNLSINELSSEEVSLLTSANGAGQLEASNRAFVGDLAHNSSVTSSLKSLNTATLSTDETLPLKDLEEQGFYAQSLVSSLMGSDSAVKGLSTAPSMGTELAKGIHVIPQQAGLAAESKLVTSAQALTASELDEAMSISTDRFLGAEQSLRPLGQKNATSLGIMPTPISMATAQSPIVTENTVSLALALNVDPTSQSLEQLIDSEAIEQGELDVEMKNLERKQDDQTLKLTKGQQAWGEALTERITMNAAQDVKQVTIHLDPPELGSLELKLQINDDKQAQIQVQVQSPQVKEALESSAHRLRDMLASEGLELSGLDVQTDTGPWQQSADNSDGQDQGQSQDSDASQNGGEDISVEIEKPKNNNLLDTFA